MRRLRAFFIRLLEPLRWQARERELRDELEAHLQLHVDDNVRTGLSPIEARRAVCVGLAASYLPARRAARMDPMAALRSD